MKELFKQLLNVWRRAKPLHKLLAVALLLSMGTFFGVQFFGRGHGQEVMLYGNLSGAEEEEVRHYLDGLAIPYRDHGGGIHVAADHADRVRYELSTLGVGEEKRGKGFELFDTNTWIKGEKELQVLEMRALKGQLEKDLAGFENIKNASVILDIAPARTFGGQQYKTKASVIVTLMHGAYLTTSQLKAITYHLAGAVRGLEPEMIAISDTKGRLYQAQGEHDVIVEEQVRNQVDALCSKLFGQENFHTNIQMVGERVSVGVVVNRAVGALPKKGELARQLILIGHGLKVQIEPVVDYLPFEKRRSSWVETQEHGNRLGIVFLFLALCIAVTTPILIYIARKKEDHNEQKLVKMMTRIDTDRLAASIKGEEPETIALMLSYLESSRADKLLAALPETFKEEVLVYMESAR